jgi:tetratricopeptide (TPR) repeat protein
MRPITLALTLAASTAGAMPFAAQASDYANMEPPAGTFAANIASPHDLVVAREALQQGQYERAAWLLGALADGSRNPQVQLMAGFAHLGSGQTARAEGYFHRSLRLDGDSAIARQGMGLVALARGDRDGAKAELAKLEQAAARCTGTCTRAAQIESAAASLRRAIG